MPDDKPRNPAALRSHRSADPFRWTPRHLGDEMSEKHRRSKAGAEERGEAFREPPPRGNERTQCRCGRLVPAFAMVDVRALDAGVTGGQEFACDACWSAWIRNGKLTRMEWLRGLGAPDKLVEAHEKHGKPHLP